MFSSYIPHNNIFISNNIYILKAIYFIIIGNFIFNLCRWIVTRKRYKSITHIPQFYPPNNYDVAEMSFISSLNRNDMITKIITGLIIQLANKKLININKQDNTIIISNLNVSKDKTDMTKNQAVVYNKLFEEKNIVEINKDYHFFYIFKAIQNNLGNDFENLIYDSADKTIKTKMFRWIICDFVLFLIINLVFPNISINLMVLKILSAMSFLALSIITLFTKNKTVEGNALKMQTTNFINFIKESDNNKIQQITKDNPAYPYDILPYAYLYNYHKTWIKRCKNYLNQEYVDTIITLNKIILSGNWHFGDNL